MGPSAAPRGVTAGWRPLARGVLPSPRALSVPLPQDIFSSFSTRHGAGELPHQRSPPPLAGVCRSARVWAPVPAERLPSAAWSRTSPPHPAPPPGDRAPARRCPLPAPAAAPALRRAAPLRAGARVQWASGAGLPALPSPLLPFVWRRPRRRSNLAWVSGRGSVVLGPVR